MKKRHLICTALLLSSFFLCGCSAEDLIEEDRDTARLGVIAEEDVEEGIYIMTADGDYYQPNTANQSFSSVTNEASPNRITWVNDNNKEIPSLYSDDTLVYFSSEEIPAYFSVERFLSVGYTFGIYNASLSTDGEIVFSADSLISGTDADNLFSQAMEGGVMSLISVDGNELSEDDLSRCGSIKGLEKDHVYTIGVYKGTYYEETELTADTRIFYSSLVDQTTGIDKTKDGYAIIRLPELEDGYYSVNGTGLFHYIPDEARP